MFSTRATELHPIQMKMNALVTTGNGKVKLQTVDLPLCTDTDILVQVHSVTQNPTDCRLSINYMTIFTDKLLHKGKTVALHRKQGNIIGCDFSGVVVRIGKEVPSNLRYIGERVAGMVHGGTYDVSQGHCRLTHIDFNRY